MILALALAVVRAVSDLDGRPVDPFDAASAETRAIVLVFMHPDCPVSNRYVPEINRLYDAFTKRGMRMWVVYSGTSENVSEIRIHRATYRIKPPALLDPAYTLADYARATVTAEAVVYAARRDGHARWRPVYRGRIDDRSPRLGVWRSSARSRDLADVLERLDTAGELAFRSTQAIGCYIKPLS